MALQVCSPPDRCKGSRRGLGVASQVLLTVGASLLVYRVSQYGLLAFTNVAAKLTKPMLRSSVALEAGTTLERKRSVASEWRLGVGHAIDVLRRDVVGLFGDTPYTPDFSIYSSDIQVVDARLPSFKLKGIATYQQILSTLQWSVRTTCDRTQLEITSMSPPVNNELYMRWRLKLWFKDVLGDARSLLAPAFGSAAIIRDDMPFIVEGYSRYEFDSWSAEIVKHTIDITNPPMYIADLVAQYARGPTWMVPTAGIGIGVPTAMQPTYSQMVDAKQVPMLAIGSDGSSENQGSNFGPGSWFPSWPQGCEDDFECNDGKANFPLQCCELPIIGKFCCEPDDFRPNARLPAYVPLPVPVEEPWQREQR